MADNTALWDKLKRVPKEHLKGFKRSGGFTGTAIKPMWSFHRMTEEFGPCGTGWGVEKPEFTIQAAGNDLMVYCTVAIWYGNKEAHVWGVGGDKVLSTGQSGPRTDDEAFKKAFTDAVTNALKMIGAGADVHMGLFDGSKYIDEKPKDRAGPHSPDNDVERDPDSDTAHFTGTPGASKAPARNEYDRLIREMRQAQTVEALREWYKLRRPEINALPSDWMNHLDEDCQKHKDALQARAA